MHICIYIYIYTTANGVRRDEAEAARLRALASRCEDAEHQQTTNIDSSTTSHDDDDNVFSYNTIANAMHANNSAMV